MPCININCFSKTEFFLCHKIFQLKNVKNVRMIPQKNMIPRKDTVVIELGNVYGTNIKLLPQTRESYHELSVFLSQFHPNTSGQKGLVTLSSLSRYCYEHLMEC